MLQMFIVWGALESLRYLLACLPHDPSVAPVKPATGAHLVDSKETKPRIVTSVAESGAIIAEWKAASLNVEVDIPMDTSLEVAVSIMDFFAKNGAGALLSGPNISGLLQKADILSASG
jgi:hypothetical protein